MLRYVSLSRKAIRWGRLLLPAVAIEIVFISIRSIGDSRGHLPEIILSLLIASTFYIFSAFTTLNNLNEEQGLPVWLIVTAALLFRITVWPIYPALSDDVFRYRWEGQIQAAGGNPYQARPNDPQWAGLRDAAFPLVVAKDFKAGYGPLLELLEGATYWAATRISPDPFVQAFWFKAPGAVCDLGIIGVLAALLRARGKPVALLLVYAWCPLAVVEFWATGHNDSVAVLLVSLALLAAARERWKWAFLALTLAVAAKLWPVLLFPSFIGWRRGPQRWWQWLVGAPVALALALPYWSAVSENARFMTGFVGGWRNNDSLFGALLWAGGTEARAKILAFTLIGAVALWATLRRLPLELAVLVTLTGALMVSSNSHPWYLTWVLPLLAFYPAAAMLLWVSLAPLAYHVVIQWVILGDWQHVSELRWLIYIPVYSMFLVCAAIHAWRRRAAVH